MCVTIVRTRSKLCSLTVALVETAYQDYIFDPYFSTRLHGVGLGLTIAGEIINEYYAGALELLDSGPLPGGTFHITLHIAGK